MMLKPQPEGHKTGDITGICVFKRMFACWSNRADQQKRDGKKQELDDGRRARCVSDLPPGHNTQNQTLRYVSANRECIKAVVKH